MHQPRHHCCKNRTFSKIYLKTMRNFLISVCFWIPFCCYSQFFDDFSYKNLSENPQWSGSTDHFKINKSQQLQLSNTGNAGTSWLYTNLPAPVSDITEWSFRCILKFNPSKYNFARVYLRSDQTDFSSPLNGYYILLGGEDDEIALFRQNGEIHTRLAGNTKRVNSTSNDVEIKVSYHKNGEWMLLSKLGDEKNWITEGEALSAHNGENTLFGPYCKYTKTNSEKFHFDYFRVTDTDTTDPPVEEEPDTDPPYQPADSIYIESLVCTTPREIVIRFNDKVDLREAWITLNEEGYSLQPVLSADSMQIRAAVTPDLISGYNMLLLICNLFNTAGKRQDIFMYPFVIPSFEGGDPDGGEENPDESGIPYPEFRDEILLSEIMANPKGCTLLPEAEYVEIYNNTDHPLQLENMSFHYGTKTFLLPPYILAADEYAILCHSNKVSLYPESCHPVGIDAFPAIANTGKLIYLETRNGDLLDWVEFSDKWYGDAGKSQGGYSLERIDSGNRFPDERNWTGAVAAEGGTPGKPNSVAAENPDTTFPFIRFYTRDENGMITLRFSKPIREEKDPALLFIPSEGIGIDSIRTDYPCNTTFYLYTDHTAELPFEIRLGGETTCISGNAPEGNTALSFGEEIIPSGGDILINELLFHPAENTGIFIELLNSSEKTINLNQLCFAIENSNGTPGTLYRVSDTGYPLLPQQYALVSADIHSLFGRYLGGGTPLYAEPAKLPALKTGKGILLLLNPEKEIIDRFPYSEELHTTHLIDKTGISLERISPAKGTATNDNWQSASEASGFATPGYANSEQERSEEPAPGIDGENRSGFRLVNRKVSLKEGSEESALTVAYNLPEEENYLSASLYNSSGVELCKFTANESISGEGTLYWDAELRGSSVQNAGIYIIWLEWRSNSGRINKQKLIFPIIP